MAMQVPTNFQRAVAALLLVVYAAFVLLWSTHVWMFHHHHTEIAQGHFNTQTPTWEGVTDDSGVDHHCGLCHWLVQTDAPPSLLGTDYTAFTFRCAPAPCWYATPFIGTSTHQCVLLRGPPTVCFF